VRQEIEMLYRQQQAARQYTEAADSFTNTVYEQSDSLQPAASRLSLEVKKAERVGRNPDPSLPADSPLRNPQLLGMLFGDEALNAKRNTEALEVAPGVMASARVVQHHPATRQPLEEVKDQVKARVIAAEAARLAKEQGEKLLASLKSADQADLEGFAAATTITRASPGDLAPQAVAEVFKLPVEPLPTYTGVDLGPGGYQLIRLEKASGPDPTAEERRKAYHDQVERVLSQTAVSAYVEQVKSGISIERNLRQ
jgi:peptidyl-prolyl cis-trans isomerase D